MELRLDQSSQINTLTIQPDLYATVGVTGVGLFPAVAAERGSAMVVPEGSRITLMSAAALAVVSVKKPIAFVSG